MALKIAFIGAGSLGFTRRLVYDVLAVPEFGDAHFALHDINEHNLEMVSRLLRRDIEGNELPARVTTHLERRAAVADADYVVCCVRVGGLEAFKLDIEIPLRYGVDQCVGDTLCAGGIMYGQRTIPCILDFCRDIREAAKPGALFLNYSNPNAMNTWAANKYGGVPTIGLCHGVQGGHVLLADALGIPRDELDYICAGINHQTWYISLKHKGRDITADELTSALERHPTYSRTEKVRIDMLKRFGYFTTESNGHVSEYVPWYRKRPDEIRDWIDLAQWIHGETGGYLRVCTENRNWFDTEYPNLLKKDPPRIGPDNRSHEHGSFIVEGLETGRTYRGHFNVVNRGIITNLPDGCIVEVPGYVDATGVHIPVIGDLPLACAATCAASVRVQEMAVEAAVRGDVALLKQAMLHDPLTAAVLNPPEIWQLTDEMLAAQARWLPQYQAGVEQARSALEHPIPIRAPVTGGAARKKVRTIEEIRAGKKAAIIPAEKNGKAYDPNAEL
ncbi:MAG: alpha-glucosidase/alpha-galactosidase [Kiritimatiellaeota bacterium]|nr:alpha-glucosidase/alpha-galactosidase [Kiritimatiellota bacterium]